MPRFYITQAQIQQIRRLLQGGFALSEIARLAGTSRATVTRVRGCGDAECWSTSDGPHQAREPVRCKCGAMVTTPIPCLACRLRDNAVVGVSIYH